MWLLFFQNLFNIDLKLISFKFFLIFLNIYLKLILITTLKKYNDPLVQIHNQSLNLLNKIHFLNQ